MAFTGNKCWLVETGCEIAICNLNSPWKSWFPIWYLSLAMGKNAILSFFFTRPVFGWGEIGWVGRFRRKRATAPLPRKSEFSYLWKLLKRRPFIILTSPLSKHRMNSSYKTPFCMIDSVLRSLFSHPDSRTKSYPIVLLWDSNELNKESKEEQTGFGA